MLWGTMGKPPVDVGGLLIDVEGLPIDVEASPFDMGKLPVDARGLTFFDAKD